jgi:DNA-binding GntR family transcriptional regulator
VVPDRRPVRARGLAPSYLTRSVTTAGASPEVAEALGIKPQARLCLIDRLLLANDMVIGLSLSWLSPAVVDIAAALDYKADCRL